jgi:hypothetical protein
VRVEEQRVNQPIEQLRAGMVARSRTRDPGRCVVDVVADLEPHARAAEARARARADARARRGVLDFGAS